MSIKIILPEGEGVRSACGTKVYTDSGYEIKDVSRINIDIKPDNIIEATIAVAISKIENLRGLNGIIIAEGDLEDVKE